MLAENRQVRQEPDHRRRWFEQDGLELIVWLDGQDGVEGFQLCRAGHALTWRRAAGFAYSRVDEGDETPLKNLTPILVPNGAVPWAELTDVFRTSSATLDSPLRELILARLSARN